MAYTFAGEYFDALEDATTGKPVPGVAVTVYATGTTTKATLYTDRTKGTATSNPTSTSVEGNLQFFTDPGRYDLLVNGRTLGPFTIYPDVADVEDVTTLLSQLAAKVDTAGSGLTKTGTTLAADFGTAAGKVTQANDARLSDARTPVAHAHAETDVTNLATDLGTKANDSAVVHLTGNETVAGTKTFSSAPTVPDGSFTQAKVTNLATDLGSRTNWRGAWAATTAYVTNDLVSFNGGLYRAPSNFTSGGSFVLANWVELVAQSGTYAPAGSYEPTNRSGLDFGLGSGSGPVTVTYASVWGIDSSGVPYFDASGAVVGEEAVMTINSTTGEPVLTKVVG